MPYKKKAALEAQPILQGRKNSTLKEADKDVQYAIAGLVIQCLAEGNAVYLTPGRFGGVQFKVYVEGDQFAEYLEVNGGADELVEAILDALYTTEVVARYRATFGTGRAVRPQEVRQAKREG